MTMSSGQERYGVNALTPEEITILALTAQGLTSKQIAKELGRSFRAITVIKTTAFTRLGVSNSSQAILRLIEAKKITASDLKSSFDPDAFYSLSQADQRLLSALSIGIFRGADYCIVAEQCGVAQQTAKNHASQLMKRLGFLSRVQLAAHYALYRRHL